MAGICETYEWKSLTAHAKEVNDIHLRDLLKDDGRTEAMTMEHNGIYLDFSRQNATLDTLKVGCV